MNIDVCFLGVMPNNALRGHVEQRVRQQIERYQSHVTQVIVCIGRARSLRKLASRCRVTLRGPGVPALSVEMRSNSYHSAFDVAVDHVTRNLRRQLCRAAWTRAAMGRVGHTGMSTPILSQ